MATLTLRGTKGSKLTHTELDNNLTALNNAKLETTGGTLTGDLVVPSLNGGPLAGLRNKIINGNFDIWQRGTSFTTPNNVYTADRFLSSVSGGGTLTREAFTLGQTDVPGEPTYFVRLAASTTGGANLIAQRIEDVRTLAGKVVTLSFWVKGPNGATTLSDYPQIRQNFGSGGSTEVNVNGSAVTFTGSWQKVVQTFTLPSIAGKTIGVGSHLVVYPVRFASQAITVDVAQVQLEEGPIATPFEQRPIGLELALCRRYYQRFPEQGLDATGKSIAIVTGASTTLGLAVIPLPVPMRIVPLLEQTGVSTDYVLYRTTSSALSGVPSIDSSSTTQAAIVQCPATYSPTSGLTFRLNTATTNAYLGLSAEL